MLIPAKAKAAAFACILAAACSRLRLPENKSDKIPIKILFETNFLQIRHVLDKIQYFFGFELKRQRKT